MQNREFDYNRGYYNSVNDYNQTSGSKEVNYEEGETLVEKSHFDDSANCTKNNSDKSTATNRGAYFLLFRIIVAALIALLLFSFKYLMPDVFGNIKKQYNDSFGVNVTASYYIGDNA